MNLEKNNQGQEILQNKVLDSINNSNLSDFLASEGLAEQVIRFEVILDLDKIQNENVKNDQELNKFSREISPENSLSVSCCWCTTLQACIRCEDFFEQCP